MNIIPYLLNMTSHMHVLLKERVRKDSFTGLPLTALVIVFIVFLSTFFGLTTNIRSSAPIVNIDVSIERLLVHHRTTGLTQFFLFATLLGKLVTVTIVSALMTMLFLFRKHRSYIVPFFATLIGSSISIYFIKILINRARPGADVAYYIEKTQSFPSGHASISIALYGYIAYYFMAKSISWRNRRQILYIALVVMASIGFSRMYLGVHYLSDVLGGYLIGALWLLIGITITELMRYRGIKTL